MDKSKTYAASVIFHPLGQWFCRPTWKITVEKIQTNATNMILPFLMHTKSCFCSCYMTVIFYFACGSASLLWLENPWELFQGINIAIGCFLWVWWVCVGDGWVGSGSVDSGHHQLSENIWFVWSKHPQKGPTVEKLEWWRTDRQTHTQSPFRLIDSAHP